MNIMMMADRGDALFNNEGGGRKATASGEAGPSLGPRGAPAHGNSPVCILLVDDDDAVRETLVELLELEGYRTLQAADGHTALTYLESRPIDFLITDLSMPGSDGITLIKQGKAARNHLPAILLTGYAEEPSLVSASAGTQFHVLRKPVEANQLIKQIRLLMQPKPGTD